MTVLILVLLFFQVEMPDIQLPVKSDTTENGTSLLEFPVLPFHFEARPGYEVVATDSTLRWQMWLEPYDWYSRRPGAIMARQGAYARHDGIMYFGHENLAQHIEMDGMDQRDPVTGSVNMNRIPHLRISRFEEQSWGLANRSLMEQRRFYVNKPLTWINLDHTSANTRSTEGILAMNYNRRTGMDFSYWGKNSTGEYTRSQMTGRMMTARVYHYLNPQWVLQSQLLYSGHQADESGGYQIADMNTFDFEPIGVAPNVFGARSSLRSTQIQVGAWRRQGAERPADWFFGVHHNRYRRFYKSPTDTTFYRVMEAAATVRNHTDIGPFSINSRGRVTTSHADPERRRSLGIAHWFTGEVDTDAKVNVWNMGEIAAGAAFKWRSDGLSTGELRSKLTAGFEWFQLYASMATGGHLPSIQQMYWRSDHISGNESLKPVLSTRVEAGFTAKHGLITKAGIRGFYHQTENPVYLAPDSIFRAIPKVASAGGVMDVEIETRRWEAGYSITLQRYFSDSFQIQNQFLEGSGTRIWNKAHIYWKGYLFNRATYVKTGFSGIFSPNPYRAPLYIPSADLWDPAQDVDAIPFFARLDWDLSARVRSMFVFIRMENMLDGYVTPGYFESEDYPMVGRRTRFGMRVVFRN